jgi:hypothetical protein
MSTKESKEITDPKLFFLANINEVINKNNICLEKFILLLTYTKNLD